MRGLCLLSLAVSHFGGPLYNLSWQPLGFVSAAELFFFLAGVVGGATSWRRLRTAGEAVLATQARARSWRIYRAHLGSVTAAATLIAVVGHLAPEPLIAWRHAWQPLVDAPVLAMLGAASFLYLPSPFDILPLYCGFFLLVPWVVRAYDEGRVTRFLMLSLGVWGVSQLTLGRLLHWALRVVPGADAPDFDVFGWQLIFVVGVVLGCAAADGRLNSTVASRRAWLTLGTLAVVLAVARHAGFEHGRLGEWLTGRPALGPVRAIDFAVLATLAWGARDGLGRHMSQQWLGMIGRHPLPVFSTHLVLLVAIAPWRGRITEWGPAAEVAAALAFAGVLIVPALWAEHRLLDRVLRLVRIRRRAGFLVPSKGSARRPG